MEVLILYTSKQAKRVQADRYISALLSPHEKPPGDFHGKTGNSELSGGKPPPNPQAPT